MDFRHYYEVWLEGAGMSNLRNEQLNLNLNICSGRFKLSTDFQPPETTQTLEGSPKK